MAFPVVESRASGSSSTTNATTYTIPITGVPGELIVVCVSADGAPTLSTTSPGYSVVATEAYSTTVTGTVFKKIATGSDTLVVTSSASEQFSHWAYRISGASDVVSVSETNHTSAWVAANKNLVPPITGQPAEDSLFLFFRSGDSTITATDITDFTNLASQAASGSTGASTDTAYLAQRGSLDYIGITAASEQFAAFVLRVVPTIPGTGPAVEYAVPTISTAGTTDGSGTWTNPSLAASGLRASSTVANSTLGGANVQTRNLLFSGFNIDLPADATVTDIEFSIWLWSTASYPVAIDRVYTIIGGSRSGSNLGDATAYTYSHGAGALIPKGGSGYSLTGAQLNDAGFGMDIGFAMAGGTTSRGAYLNGTSLKIIYTPSGSPPTPPPAPQAQIIWIC